MSVNNEGRRAVALTTGPASSDVPTDKAGRRKNKTALRQAAKALAPEGSRVNGDLAEGVSDGTLSPLRFVYISLSSEGSKHLGFVTFLGKKETLVFSFLSKIGTYGQHHLLVHGHNLHRTSN
jgi:hypothetical protein